MQPALNIFDKSFLPSAAILIFGSFAVSFVFTRIVTSKTVARTLSGKTAKRAVSKRATYFEAMRREIEILRDGRTDEELDEEEKEEIKAIRRYYARKANEMEDE